MKTTKYQTGACSFGDCLNTYSRYKFENGDVYEGIIKNSLLDVYGSYLYNDGSFYVGGFEKGKKNGYGLTYDIKTGKFYNTNYKNNVLIDYTAKTYGFAQSENGKKLLGTIKKLNSEIPEENKIINDLEETQRALLRFEISEKPIKISKVN